MLPVSSFLQSLSFGPPQVSPSGRLTVLPLVHPDAFLPDYLSLSEALQKKELEITEVNQGGSVPELAVANHAHKPVLLMDGEELAGAKQNRVLNTSILVAAGGKLIVPVSCTEQGRWNYLSPTFSSSGHVMSSEIRRKKTRSVSASLQTTGTHLSDQSEVWNEITTLHENSGSTEMSPTHAMSDAYAVLKTDLDQLSASFPAVPGQTGLVVIRDGVIDGCDVLSRPEVYAQLHSRLVRSYAIDALGKNPVDAAQSPAPAAADPQAAARTFLQTTAEAQAASHPSPGLGEDQRLTAPQLIGSALVVDGQVIHLAAFAIPTAGSAHDPSIASSSRRRKYRSDQ